MDPITIAILALRGVAAVLTTQGQTGVATTINTLIVAYEAGKNVDAYMAEVADGLKNGLELADWDEITGRINAEVDEFLARE